MWWFYTVILGMSFGQILGELAVAVREWARSRRPFVPGMLWLTFLLILVVEVWLAVTYYRTTFVRISVLELLAFLMVPAGILVMSYLLPDAKQDRDEPSADDFDRVRPVFFGVLIAVVAINLLHDFLIGQQGLDADLLFQCLLVAGALIGLKVHGLIPDTVLAVVMIAVLCTYIGLEYSTVLVAG